MSALRDLPGLFKRHYEKVLLGFALIGLIGAIVALNGKKQEENDKLLTYERGITRRAVKPLQSVDMSMLQEAMKRSTNPASITLAPPHNLFNPVKWQQARDGRRLKVETGKEVGPDAMQLVGITPLHLIITLDQPSGSGVNMSVTQEAHTNRLWRARMQSFLTTANASERRHRSGVFRLVELKTTPDGAQADIELADGTKATVTQGKPFTRVEGYKAEMKYPPENNKNFPDARVGDELTLAGEKYNIVAINPNEVVVSARSNNRRYNIRNNAGR